jgi:DNA invertase Pin-like site-specific DNA recombinase
VKLVPYLRVSTDRQASEGTGLDVQLDTIKRWAKANGHKLTAPCTDQGVSGTKELDNRPGLLEAVDALKDRRADGIVVYRLDRLARDVMLQETLLADIKRKGCRLYSTSDSENEFLVDDPTDPSRKLIRTILGSVAEYERSMIALRLRSARDRKAANGGYAGFGSPAFGLRSDGGRLVPDEREQLAVKRIVQLRSQDYSLPRIVEQLAHEGITSKHGGPWHPTTVARVLQRHGEAVQA